MHQHSGGYPSSKKGGVATSPAPTMPTRNDGGNSHPSSSKSSSSSLPQKFIHENPKHHSVQQHREIIELTDSDNDNTSSTIIKPHNSPNVSRTATHLQPPFDPFPRAPNGSSSKSGHRASASPSIASLINPDHSHQPKQSDPSPTSAHATEPYIKSEHKQEKSTKKRDSTENANRSPKSKANTAASSTAASPKPSSSSRAVVSTGNGLLAGVLPNTGPDEPEPEVPSIYLHVPLNGENNKYVNFAKLAEERYGWAALNPKLAKARQMMDSGDEMMLDGSESESNVDMAGPGDSTAEPKKRAKRKNHDIYDKNDPFIDDSEMLWEEQAAASKDGFFVYSGPLVPEGEKPQIERADGTVKRGRGRGRGNTRGAASTRGATVRKPRLTKKEKEKMEREKEERERFSTLQMAAAASKVPMNLS